MKDQDLAHADRSLLFDFEFGLGPPTTASVALDRPRKSRAFLMVLLALVGAVLGWSGRRLASR